MLPGYEMKILSWSNAWFSISCFLSYLCCFSSKLLLRLHPINC